MKTEEVIRKALNGTAREQGLPIMAECEEYSRGFVAALKWVLGD